MAIVNLQYFLMYTTISVFSIVLYKWHYSFVVDVWLKDPKYTLLQRTERAPVPRDQYEQLIDLQDFTFVKMPAECDRRRGPLLLLMVPSKPSNDASRTFIRKSWGKKAASMRLVFLLGLVKDPVTKFHVHAEMIKNKDLIVGNFIDSYHNMTYKHVMGLKWTSHHCPTARYVLKVDDDTPVNIQLVRKFLAKKLSPFGARDLILCPTKVNSPVLRSKASKWAVSTEEYADNWYPTYCLGYFILYSQDVVGRILEAAQKTKYFWIDDVHLTGTVAQGLAVERTDITQLGIRMSELVPFLRGDTFSRPLLYGPYNMNLEYMKSLWAKFKQNTAMS